MSGSRAARLVLCGTCLIGTGALSASARAEEPDRDPYPSARHGRLFLGVSGGQGSSGVSASGRSMGGERAAWREGLEFGLSQPLGHGSFGLQAVARAGSLDTAWSESRGETRYAADLGVGPLLWTDTRWRRPDVQLRLAAPVGFTHAWVNAGDGILVAEHYSQGNGFHAGLTGGIDLSGAHHGIYLDVSYVFRTFWLDHTARLLASPEVSTSESYHFIDTEILLSVGYSYRP